jgi:flagellar hook-associated protein 1 FlgK
MGTSPLMSLGIKAMAANYAALQTTGHNIANANTVGYSRQQADMATSQGQFTGAGFFGRGVDVVTVSRAHNDYLTREAASAKSLAGMDGARLQQLQQLENIFKPGEMGLGNATADLMNALTDLTSQPADLATRQVVLARAADLAARFSEAGAALDDVQASTTSQLRTSITTINSLAKSIAEINQRIAGTKGLGQAPNDLLDQRDQMISDLSQHIQVTRLDASDGTVGIFVAGGQRLVLGTEAATMKVGQDQSDPSRAAVTITEGPNQRALASGALGGGLGGLLKFQNDDLSAARNQIGRLAAALGGTMNDQQAKGLTLQTPLGQVAGSPLFTLGPMQALPNANNVRNASNMPVGVVTLTLADPSALQASDYDLRETAVGSGSWVLTRLSDGAITAVNSGDVVDGMRIDFTAAPQAGDTFLLQPVARAANGMGRLLDDPRDLAAASPLVASASPSNVGTAAVDSLSVLTAPLPTPGATARITFTSNAGDYTWELFDSGNVLLNSGTATWQAGQPIPPAGTDINGFSMSLTGVPRNGDVLTVEPTTPASVASNNGNAAQMVALRDAALVSGRTLTDAWSYAMADVGVRVQSGRSSADISDAAAGQAEQMRSSQAGVNLDEEAARLIQYQQSYQAAAKILQVAQQLFDTLLQTAGQ